MGICFSTTSTTTEPPKFLIETLEKLESSNKKYLKMKRLIKYHVKLDVNQIAGGYTRLTPLHIAVYQNDLNFATYLVKERKANVNIAERSGVTPIILAAINGRLDLCEFLFLNGAEVDAADLNGRTALTYAVIYHHFNVCEWLCSRSVDPEVRATERSKSIFACAAEGGHLDICHLLGSYGGDANARDSMGVTPFMIAAEQGFLNICEYIYSIGAVDNINQADKNGVTTAMYAQKNNHADVVKFLQSKGAEINTDTATAMKGVVASDDRAPLLSELSSSSIPHAVESTFLKDIQTELEKGKSSTGEGYTKMKAIVYNKPFNRDLDVNKAGENNLPIHIAAHKGDVRFLTYLLRERKALVDSKNRAGETALMWAAEEGNLESCRIIVANGADLKLIDSQGKTAFYYAKSKGKTEVEHFLSAALNNPNPVVVEPTLAKQLEQVLVDQVKRMPPTSWQCREGKILNSLNTVKVMRLVYNDPEIDVNAGETVFGIRPIHIGAFVGDLEFVQYLIDERNADVNFKEMAGGWTPLMFAAANGHLKVSQALHAHGADILAKSNAKQTILAYAAQRGYAEVCEFLCSNGADVDDDGNGLPVFLSAGLSAFLGRSNERVLEILLAHGAKGKLGGATDAVEASEVVTDATMIEPSIMTQTSTETST